MDEEDERSISNDQRADDDKRALMFPHIVGYYAVSCTTRGQGIGHLRDAVTELASKLIGSNPDIPRRWLNVERSLVGRAERSGSVCTVDELKDIASVQGVNEPLDVLNMIHFFRAQGRILYFPQVGTLFHSCSRLSSMPYNVYKVVSEESKESIKFSNIVGLRG